MDDEARRAIGKKYQRGVEDLISKYMCQEEDELDVIDILYSEEEQCIPMEEISFIKNTKRKEMQSSASKLFLFNDIYRILCHDCDFEDIYQLLK